MSVQKLCVCVAPFVLNEYIERSSDLMRYTIKI